MKKCVSCGVKSLLKTPVSDLKRKAIGLPDRAFTPGQKELQSRHGTPRQFAEACAKAIGEISPKEADEAVDKYLKEWNEA